MFYKLIVSVFNFYDSIVWFRLVRLFKKIHGVAYNQLWESCVDWNMGRRIYSRVDHRVEKVQEGKETIHSAQGKVEDEILFLSSSLLRKSILSLWNTPVRFW